MDGYADYASQLELCDVVGAPFLCPLALVYRDGEFVNSGLGQLYSVVGSWPTNLWALRYPSCIGQAHYEETPACPFGLEVARWSDQKWKKERFVKLDQSQDILHSIRPWPHGHVLLFDNRLVASRRGDPTIANYIEVVGPKPHPALDQRKKLDDPDFYFEVRMGGPDEALVTRFRTLPGDSGQTEIIERWLPEKRVESTEVPEGYNTLPLAWSHMLAFQSSSPPRGKYFDGASWTSFELPAWGRDVLSFAREPDGTFWVVVSDGRSNSFRAPLESRVYRRKPNAPWDRLVLPSPKFPGASDDRVIKPLSVRALGVGDVWVGGWTAGDCGRGVLLHTKPPKRFCFVERFGTECAPEPRKPHDGSACPGLLGQPLMRP